MIDFSNLEVWFVTGSQHLYGPETLETVRDHTIAIAQELSGCSAIPVKVIPKPVMTGSEAVRQLCLDANSNPNCIGLIAWMHTFSRRGCGLPVFAIWPSHWCIYIRNLMKSCRGLASTWSS